MDKNQLRHELEKLRKSIDTLDGRIVALLNQRSAISRKIGRLKARFGQGVYAAHREKEIFSHLVKVNRGPLSNEALTSIYREVMSSSLALEKPLQIAYLGPSATFTHLAAMKRFGSLVRYVSCEDIPDVFLAVEKGTADYGVVPIENSTEGAVTHTLDMFIDSDLKICAQIILDISHNLLSRCKKDQIRRIYSNPQVFAQCRHWLETNLPKAEKIEVSSTTRAAQISSHERYSACVASLLAAEEYNLTVVDRDIEDSPHNFTRFLVISKADTPPSGQDKTSILFSIKDRVGALHDILSSFKKFRINLTKIESRPSRKKAWDYYFFVDFLGHVKDKKVQRALRGLEKTTRFLKILGSYPM